MKHVTYNELVEIYGQNLASALLKVIERACQRKSNVIPFDKGERLESAMACLGGPEADAGKTSVRPEPKRRREALADPAVRS
jgi:hypothetical protein